MSKLDKVIKRICLDRKKLDALDVLLTHQRGVETYHSQAHRFGLATKTGRNYEAWPEWEELMSAVDEQDSELRDWVGHPTEFTNGLLRQMAYDIKRAIYRDEHGLEGGK